jgi:hypothetical protein
MNEDRFIATMREMNACTFYMLPLLRIEAATFGGEVNILNSYISKDGTVLGVVVLETLFVSESKMPQHSIKKKGGQTVYVFRMPDEHRYDIHLFLQGKYSTMSKFARDLIHRFIKGFYALRNEPEDEYLNSIWILALDKSSEVKDLWDSILYDHKGQSVIDDMELISAPNDSYFLENFLVEV